MKRKIHRQEALLAFAVAGMLSGALGASCGKPAPWGSAAVTALEKHACHGYNSCKSKGGCKSGDNGCAGKNSCKGKGGCATVDKHSCMGQNSCKGLGGCSGGDNGCKTKNSCKGKGGCEVPLMR